MRLPACLIACASLLLAPGCVTDTNIARTDAGADVVTPDAPPPDTPPDTPPLDAETCPSDLFAALGTPCVGENRVCGTCSGGPCTFCNQIRCAGGRWQRMETFPDPRCNDAGDAGDASDAMSGTCDAMPISSIASRQTVRFRFPAAAAGYVVTDGFFCGGMRVERVFAGGMPVPVTMGLGFQCICECPAPLPPSYTAARPLASTTPLEIAWDARAYATCTQSIDCAMRGFPGVPPATEVRGALVPIPAGRYRVTFGVIDTPPSRCSTNPDGSLACSMAAPSGPPMLRPYDLCPDTRPVTVEFDVPASGDVTVNVPLS